MIVRPQLAGVLPVIPTPFTPTGEIDEAAMRQIVEFAISSGAHGFVFPGVASEFNFLTIEERRTLIRTVGGALGGRPFVVGASAASVDEVVRLMDEGASAGATAAMIMAPSEVGTEPQAIIDFFGAVAARSGLEIVLQNASHFGGGLPVETVATVAAAVKSIVYVKEETLPPGPRITALIEKAPPHLAGVIGGAGSRHLYDELVRGAVAAMPAIELTDLHVALYNAFMSGDRARARELYVRSLPMLTVQTTFRMRLTKEVLVLRGVIAHAGVRAPLPEFDAIGHQELAEMVAEIDDLLSVRKEAAQ